MTTPNLIPDLKRDEGCRLTAYPDPESPLGKACEVAKIDVADYATLPGWQRLGGDPWTIGYGHTGHDVVPGLVWTQAQADARLEADIVDTFIELDTRLPWWRQLDDVREDVIANMAFEMGVRTLATFNDFLGLVKIGKYNRAGLDMLGTEWARQVPLRARRLARQMSTGVHA